MQPAPRCARQLWTPDGRCGLEGSLQAFGLEALLLMRLEKGFLHVATDTDGTTVPDDVGFGKVAAGKAADFIGKRSLLLPENVRPDRLQLVGLLRQFGETSNPFIVGRHLRIAIADTGDRSVATHFSSPISGAAGDAPASTRPGTTTKRSRTDGWITSAGRAVLKGEPIALATLRAGRQQVGEQVTVHDAGTVTRATVVNPPFFDPSGDRMTA